MKLTWTRWFLVAGVVAPLFAMLTVFTVEAVARDMTGTWVSDAATRKQHSTGKLSFAGGFCFKLTQSAHPGAREKARWS
jgi:hypothetical protein